MRLCIFEDGTHESFYPLTYLRAIFELRCGATSLAEKIRQVAPQAPVAYFARDVLAPVLRERLAAHVNSHAVLQGDDLLLVNGRWLLLHPGQLPAEGPEEILLSGGTVVAARVKRSTAEKANAKTPAELLAALRQTLYIREIRTTVVSFPWELIHHNPAAIVADFKAAGKAGIVGTFSDHATVWGSKDQVYVAPTAEVQPFVCIDTKHGPVTIDEEVVVNPHTRIEGPAYVGRGSVLVGGKIREGCSFGPVCRVGGEVEESIIHGYSNKYHTGFLGHAYVGEWVNLGALTTNSDLKNDYGTVSVYVGGQPVDTGSKKVGSFIGDHTKTSIGTLLNTGAVVGIMCNLVAGPSVLPKYIPSFCWYLDGRVSKGFGLGQALETARAAMERRGVQLTEAAVELIKYTEELTRQEKMDKVRRDRKRVFR